MHKNTLNGIKRIIILGNTGFIGSYFERYCQKHFPALKVVGHSTATLDLTNAEQTGKLEEVFDATTAVVMCSMVKKEFGDSLETYAKNMQMGINLCRVLERHPVKRFVYISSTAVYGEDVHNTEITEATGVCPTSYYGMAKYNIERLLMKIFSAQKENSLLILRPPLIYGPEDRSLAYGPASFIKKAISGEPITLWGDGTELREFVYIDDLIHAMVQLMDTEQAGMINVVSGTKYCFKDILDTIAKHLDAPFSVERKERSKAKVDNCFYNDFFQQLLPDFSFTPLEQGAQKIIESELSLIK